MQEQMKELARVVIECMDALREYSRGRETSQLARLMQIEPRLRKQAEEILSPLANPEPTLFD